MAFINWKDEHRVRVPELDAQHQRLLEIMNGLYTAMLMGGKADALTSDARSK